MSISFDRAVEFYDRTRAIPPQVADLPVDALIRETNLQRNARVCELGIGTGRVASLFTPRIDRLYGVDLSLAMMQRLRAKPQPAGGSIDLAQADVLRLPFPDNIFDIMYAVHLFHLVGGWQNGIAEARRALRPGGYLLISWHRRTPDSPNSFMRQRLHELVEPYGVSTKRPGAQSEEEILTELAKWGTPPRVVDVADWTEPSTPAEILEEIDRQYFSETWAIPRHVLDAVMPALRQWAEERFGDLNREIESQYNFRWLIAKKADAGTG